MTVNYRDCLLEARFEPTGGMKFRGKAAAYDYEYSPLVQDRAQEGKQPKVKATLVEKLADSFIAVRAPFVVYTDYSYKLSKPAFAYYSYKINELLVEVVRKFGEIHGLPVTVREFDCELRCEYKIKGDSNQAVVDKLIKARDIVLEMVTMKIGTILSEAIEEAQHQEEQVYALTLERVIAQIQSKSS